MKLLIINDERQSAYSQMQRYASLVPIKDMLAITYLSSEHSSWKSYIKIGVEILKGRGEKLVILLDKFLIRQDKNGNAIRNEQDDIVEEDSFGPIIQLIRDHVLTEDDIIICDSEVRKQQYNEFNNFGRIDLEKGQVSYTQEENKDIGIATINGVKIVCELISHQEKARDIIKDFLSPEFKDLKPEIKSEINNR